MTTHPMVTPIEPVDADPVVDALRAVLVGSDGPVHERVRDAVLAVGYVPTSGQTQAQQATRTPDLLRAMIAEMGGSALDIAHDPHLRGITFEWTAVAAPAVLTVSSGQFNLAGPAVAASGGESEYVRRCAADLDTGKAVGVLALTELGGTNGSNCCTTATWDAAAGGFRLATPDVDAAKFMPNVADPKTPKVVVVTARLKIGGRDEGVLPFLVPLRDAGGRLAPGVRVAALSDKVGAAMDHAMMWFDPADCLIPRRALLGGDWACIGRDGAFECEVPLEKRFDHTIVVLSDGRLDLANAAIASARAALAGVVNYASQRRPGKTVMIDRGPVQRDLVIGLAAVWATSVLGRQLRELRATGSPQWSALWPMVAKPLLSAAAYKILVTCRRRAGAQGTLRSNYIPDWIANADNISTAEGDDQIMQVAAGKRYHALVELQLPDTPEDLPQHIELLTAREHAIADGLHRGDFGAAGPVWGWDSAAAELATATGERLAATALHKAASTATDPTAEHLLRSAAAAYALDRIWQSGGWYAAHGWMTTDKAQQICTDLTRHRSILADSLPELVAAFGIPALPGAALFARDYREPYRQLWNGASANDRDTA
ncbi:acyl-CoA dehydrogenase family protein [Nocardia sp. CA-119907]|uniref:acyl-CoA dehydrogenase family protein n=1 Tax=Nocardia sp. CA-119907 TaxID=3239973 RepID=UPI003D969394